MKTPATLSLKELAEISDAAAKKADSEARKAGIKVAGIERGKKELFREKLNLEKEVFAPLPSNKGRSVNE